jgi:DNA-binding MarR family transcriptional regulator
MNSSDAPLGLQLRLAHRRAAALAATVLEPMGITGRHFGVMLMLSRRGVSSQKELIGDLGSDKAGMVRTVDDLDRLGYIERTQSATDRRLYELVLTPAGRSAFAEASKRTQEVTAVLRADLTDDELATLLELLARIVRPDTSAPADQ